MNSPLFIAAIALMLSASAAITAATPSPSAAAQIGQTGIHPWLEIGERINAEVLLDGKEVAKLDFQATSQGMKRRPTVTFTIPFKTQRLELRGLLIDLHGKRQPFRRTWMLRNIATFSAPLYDRSQPWINRILAFAKHVDLGIGPYQTAASIAGETALRQLESRLKIKLPEPVFALANYRIEIGDSYFLAPTEIKTVTEMLLKDWGYQLDGKDGLKRILTPAARARYDRSVAVFFEVGDGYGALAWDPAGVVANEPGLTYGDRSGAQPGTPNTGVWFWLHQDTLGQWNLLLDHNGQPKSAEEAMTNALQRFAFGEIDSPENDNELVVDTANPNALLQLHFDRNDKLTPKLWLRSYDYNYSLY